MPLPKEHYQSARVNKRLKSVEQRLVELEETVAEIEEELELAGKTIVLLHENLSGLMDAWREGSLFFKGQR